MKRLFTGLMGLAIATLSGGVYAWLADTPMRVVHQHVVCPTTHASPGKDFQVLSTHQWSKGLVVLYSATCPTQDGKAGRDSKVVMKRVFGHQVVERNGITWQVSSVDSYGLKNSSWQKEAEQLIEYDISQFSQSGKRSLSQSALDMTVKTTEQYMILYGQALSPKVVAVEVTFDNGHVMRKRIEEAAFALISPGARGICELRILGPDYQILRKDELTNPTGFPLPNRLINNKTLSKHCLSISHSL
jgi:hypothetical protein